MWPSAVHTPKGCVTDVSHVFFSWLMLLFCVYPARFLATLPACLPLVSVPLSVPLQNGFAIIRPPGHHAEESTAM